MSLVLTSNISENSLNDGINEPFQYHNYLSQPLELEPDSEVAVQSVKLVKSGNIAIDNANNLFYVYSGTEQTNIENTTGIPLPVVLNQHTNKSEVNSDELAKLLEIGLAPALNDPMFVNSDLNASALVVAVERSSSGDDKGAFQGFTFNIKNSSLSGSLTDKKTEMTFRDNLTDSDWSGSWNSASATITKTEADKNCEMTATGMPLATCGGIVKASFKEAGGQWEIGLTRYQDLDNQEYVNQYPFNYLDPSDEPFYDWVAKSVYDPSGNSGSGIYQLRIYQTLNTGDPALELEEFEYWNNGPSSGSMTEPIEIFDNASAYGTTKISEVEFQITNERVRVFVLSSDGTSASHTLASGSASGAENNLKPVGASNRYLYPRVYVTDHNAKITIQKFNGVKPVNYNYDAQSSDKRQTAGPDKASLEFLLANPLYDPSDMFAGILQDVDNRDMMTATELAIKNYSQKGLNAGGGLDTDVVFITARLDEYGLFNYTKGANAGDMIGFADTPYVDSTIGTNTTTLFSYRSNSLPTMISVSSCFVRLDNFNSESYNGQNRQPSKILYHMPRFDSSSNQFGGLFFEPHERTYIKLNNAHKLIMNDFDISICDASEKLSTNLTGKTIVMLHFRKSR